MYSYLKTICGILVLVAINAHGQEVFKVENGDTINGRVLGIVDGKLSYVTQDDPEFNNHTSKIPFDGVVVKSDEGDYKYFRYKPHPYLSFGVGPGEATRDFANLEVSENYSGFATDGTIFELEVGGYIYRNFGIAMHIGSRDFSINMDFAFDTYNAPNTQIYYGGEWESNIALFGPIYSGRINDKLSIQARMLFLGGGKSFKPEWRYEYTPSTGNTIIYQSGFDEASIDYAHLIGASLRYKIGQWFMLHFSLNSFFNETNFSYLVEYTTANGNFEQRTERAKYYISDFSATLGFGFYLPVKNYKKLKK